MAQNHLFQLAQSLLTQVLHRTKALGCFKLFRRDEHHAQRDFGRPANIFETGPGIGVFWAILAPKSSVYSIRLCGRISV